MLDHMKSIFICSFITVPSHIGNTDCKLCEGTEIMWQTMHAAIPELIFVTEWENPFPFHKSWQILYICTIFVLTTNSNFIQHSGTSLQIATL